MGGGGQRERLWAERAHARAAADITCRRCKLHLHRIRGSSRDVNAPQLCMGRLLQLRGIGAKFATRSELYKSAIQIFHPDTDQTTDLQNFVCVL